eukprot:130627-Rhodomonas_salina.2
MDLRSKCSTVATRSTARLEHNAKWEVAIACPPVACRQGRENDIGGKHAPSASRIVPHVLNRPCVAVCQDGPTSPAEAASHTRDVQELWPAAGQ